MLTKQIGSNGQYGQINIDRLPDTCPICHTIIQPAETGTSQLEERFAEFLFKCPNRKCAHYFIARYSITRSAGYTTGLLQSSVPTTYIASSHTEIIEKISPSFIRIYGQGEAAESAGLDEISGVGYRRSLEFLIKDYLITLHADQATQEAIKTQMLGRCIEKYITNERIKLVAKRAAWLGNDETHYVRKWENKDITDLKKLIMATVAWIEIEQLTAQL